MRLSTVLVCPLPLRLSGLGFGLDLALGLALGWTFGPACVSAAMNGDVTGTVHVGAPVLGLVNQFPFSPIETFENGFGAGLTCWSTLPFPLDVRVVLLSPPVWVVMTWSGGKLNRFLAALFFQ